MKKITYILEKDITEEQMEKVRDVILDESAIVKCCTRTRHMGKYDLWFECYQNASKKDIDRFCKQIEDIITEYREKSILDCSEE